MFNLIKEQTLNYGEFTLYEFEHEKTKAKHFHLKADDNENAFFCAFRTLPLDSTGVAHILEHSCLDGSKKYDMKSPFFSLMKKSMKTFLNAFTSSDWTGYPFATQNKKDYFNLMDVVTDAMFFPSLRKETFLQEGWRYEFAEPLNPSSELTYKGVVYNEMKGVKSSPNSKMRDLLMSALYPNTVYANNSGGDPRDITSLSYQDFCDFHKKHYHPSNAVFLTYGDIHYEEIQEKLEELVLSRFDYQELNYNTPELKEFSEPQKMDIPYAINNEKSDDYNRYLKSWNVSDITKTEEDLYLDFAISLIAADSSSIMMDELEKCDFIKSPVCHKSSNGFHSFIAIGADGIAEKDYPKLDDLINETLQKIVDKGIPQETLEKQLHRVELARKTKYADNIPYGLELIADQAEYCLNGVDFAFSLDTEAPLNLLREAVKKPKFFENLIKEKLIDNPHRADIFFHGEPELAEKEAKEEATKLKNIQNSLSDVEKQEIINNFKALEKHQNKEDDISSLPEFSTKDIPEEVKLTKLKVAKNGKNSVYACDAPTSGLTYFTKYCYLKDFSIKDLGYLDVYRSLFGDLGYADKSYQEAQNEQNLICRGIYMGTYYDKERDSDTTYLRLRLGTSLLHKNVEKVKAFLDNYFENIRFDETQFMKKSIMSYALSMTKSYHNKGLQIAGHMSISKFYDHYKILNVTDGIYLVDFYKKLAKEIETNETQAMDKIVSKLVEIHKKVKEAFKQSGLIIVDLEENLEKDISVLTDENTSIDLDKPTLKLDTDLDVEEICLSESDVNYCFETIKFNKRDESLKGALKVIGRIIHSNFTHINIREKGGAYGGYANYNSDLNCLSLSSYRDPGISKTFNTFGLLKDWLKDENNFTDEHIEQAILGVISAFDKPLLPIDAYYRALAWKLEGVKDGDKLKFRTQILKTTREDVLRAIKEIILPSIDNRSQAAVVSEKQYKTEKGLNFKTIKI